MRAPPGKAGRDGGGSIGPRKIPSVGAARSQPRLMKPVCRDLLYYTAGSASRRQCNARWQCPSRTTPDGSMEPVPCRSSLCPAPAHAFARPRSIDAVMPCESSARCNRNFHPGRDQPGGAVVAVNRPFDSGARDIAADASNLVSCSARADQPVERRSAGEATNGGAAIDRLRRDRTWWLRPGRLVPLRHRLRRCRRRGRVALFGRLLRLGRTGFVTRMQAGNSLIHRCRFLLIAIAEARNRINRPGSRSAALASRIAASSMKRSEMQ